MTDFEIIFDSSNSRKAKESNCLLLQLISRNKLLNLRSFSSTKRKISGYHLPAKSFKRDLAEYV
jgi:hypothetical protein